MLDIETVKEYIKVLEESSLAVLEVTDEEESIRLEKPMPETPAIVSCAPAQAQTAPSQTSAPAAAVQADSGSEIKSPMVGVFYSAPAPDKPAFVNVGDKVEKGQVICIIEAMKIMNEITADKSGTICEILVDNGDVVEFDQPLFKLN